jgi:hypothetical protein
MNCEAVQRRLLGIVSPNRLPSELRAHLAYCGACRAWRRRVVRLERSVALLPVPRSRAKARFIHQFASTPPKAMDGGKEPAPRSPEHRTEREPDGGRRLARLVLSMVCSRRFAGAAAGLAAVLLLALVATRLHGWMVQPQLLKIQPPADSARGAPGLGSNVTPAERVAMLSTMAEILASDLVPLARAASGDELMTLAKLYEEVVRQGILPQARSLSDAERLAMLGAVVDQLTKTAGSAEQLAREVPVEYAEPLLTIVAVAREVSLELRGLLAEHS